MRGTSGPEGLSLLRGREAAEEEWRHQGADVDLPAASCRRPDPSGIVVPVCPLSQSFNPLTLRQCVTC